MAPVTNMSCAPTLFQSFTIHHICYIQLLPSQLAVFDMLFMAFLRSHFQIAFFSSHCSINSTLNRCSFVSQAIQICFHLRWDSLPSFWYLILNDFSWIKMDQENFYLIHLFRSAEYVMLGVRVASKKNYGRPLFHVLTFCLFQESNKWLINSWRCHNQSAFAYYSRALQRQMWGCNSHFWRLAFSPTRPSRIVGQGYSQAGTFWCVRPAARWRI